MKVISAALDARGLKFGIVASRFNDLVASKLVEGAIDALIRHGAADDDIEIVWVPGALEIALVAARLAPKVDAVICLGCIVRGETDHYRYVAGQCAASVARVSLDSGKPVAFGVLTTDSLDQALARSGAKNGNKGWDAALAAIEMARLLTQI